MLRQIKSFRHTPAKISALLIAGFLSSPTWADAYTTGDSSYGGTGRYYMGREIAHVMGFQGADWLERKERQEEEATALAVAMLPLNPDSVVADIGAGSGYFSRQVASRVPQGKVLAVDIQPEMLQLLESLAARDGIQNIESVLATEKTLNLAEKSIDLALFVDVYHELKWPREIMQELAQALRPGGRVVLLEYRAEDDSIPIIPVHKMSESQAQRELTAAGFSFVENYTDLPSQHFLVFTVQ
jgi:precorrin-6B methylase 2